MSLPVGDVTFLFSDIEGSTRLARELGAERWVALLRDHDAAATMAVASAGGTVVKHEGDGMFAVFTDPHAAAGAAIELSRAATQLGPDGAHPIRIRIGIHSGAGMVTESGQDYVGLDVHYAARLAAAGNGGQVLVSDTSVRRLGDAPLGGALVDEGFHRLRDFDEPRRIQRLVLTGVTDDGRPLRTADLPTNLPEPVTTFVGRDRELAEVADLLGRGRLVTLTGPGGTGKTRLGIGAAGAVRHRYRDGTWFVELAPVRDPGLIPSAIASAVGVRESPDVPIVDTLREYLRERELLLVIDNLEQLLPDGAGTVAGLLKAAHQLHVLVTSREILRIAGEQEYPVPPLRGGEAVELFVERARLVRPGFELTEVNRPAVTAIAERLEGLPLAVELAAARIRLLAPERILERLGRSLDLGDGARDLPERQRTLRGAVAWSVDLLSPAEQALFRRLAVFSGGWTAEQADEVVDPGGSLGMDVMNGLESLADKSLIRIATTEHGEPRFTRHAFVLEYATELLDRSSERPDCERRHAEVFAGFAETAEPHLMAEDAQAWLDLIDHERHNLRAAMRWSLNAGDPELGLRIGAAVWRFWHQRAELREGLAWLDELLAHPNAQADSASRVRALSAAGGLAYWSQRFDRAWSRYEEALAIAERLGDRALIANAEYELGFRYVVERDIAGLRRHEERALALYAELGDEGAAARASQALVLGTFLGGDRNAARELETANLESFRRSGSWYRTADSHTLLAAIEYLNGDLEAARAHVHEALAIIGPRGTATPTIGALGVAALTAIASGNLETGARLAGASAGLAVRAEVANAMILVLHLPDPVAVARERMGEAADAAIAAGDALTFDEAVALASE
ncbi:MAG TPA: adenylate/guanylate cyclase domain-containing protein [Candidatus Limnocylindrales bacterium]